MPIKFRIHSKIDLAECRKIFKEYEKADIPAVISFKEKVFGPLPARYGIFWTDKNNFVLRRWAYTSRRYGPSGYQEKIEMMGKIEGTSDNPQFVIQTKDGTGLKIIFAFLVCFVACWAVFGLMALLSNPKPGFKEWMFFQIMPLMFSLVYVLGYLGNMLFCVGFFKKLVNPKGERLSKVISSE